LGRATQTKTNRREEKEKNSKREGKKSTRVDMAQGGGSTRKVKTSETLGCTKPGGLSQHKEKAASKIPTSGEGDSEGAWHGFPSRKRTGSQKTPRGWNTVAENQGGGKTEAGVVVPKDNGKLGGKKLGTGKGGGGEPQIITCDETLGGRSGRVGKG